MIDFGFDKLALIGAVALIVIGPERLPKVARTIGHLMGKAQRYVAEVKSEVNRSIELEELKNMKTQFEDAARDVGQAVSSEVRQASTEMNEAWGELSSASGPGYRGADNWQEGSALPEPPVFYTHPGKNWRLKRGAMPQWYRARHGVRAKAQSGAARVARFRPPRAPSSP
jgi:sec-independent protein translocase protein TatB